MRILVMNCGSSSLKFELFELAEPSTATVDERRLATGSVGGIGKDAVVQARAERGEEVRTTSSIEDHRAATRWTLQWLRDASPKLGAIDVVAHRVVHGGPRLFAPVLIDDGVLREITAAGELAPLHNRAALDTIAATRELLGDAVPMVAVFDTAFHRNMPERAARYAIPLETADRHGIRRYGFHGLGHRYMNERCAALLKQPVETLRIITMHLGGGCSAAAIRGGTSVDSSMGFTPLEGLVMGTRAGDVDPAVMRFLCEHGGMTPGEVDEWLNHRCGLRGVSGASADVRELLRLESQGDSRAALALDLFCYRLRKYLGSYLAVLGGADAIAFGGGIGENAAEIRARTCRGMEWCGLRIDDLRNRDAVGVEAEISGDDSLIRAFVVPVDEEIVMARDTLTCLRKH